VPLVARLAPTAECGAAAGVSEFAEMATVLAPSVRAFAVETGGLSARDPTALAATLRAILDAIRAAAPCQKVWLVVPADAEVAEATARVRTARAVGYGGVVIDGSVRDGLVGRRMGRPAREPARALVRALRTEFGPELLVVASGGVHEPADALDLLDSGASVVLVDSGLVFAGPGLPKRINEAALYALEQTATAPTATPADAGRTVELAWFWLLLLGAGMFIGSTLAFAIAATRVVLPYDEQFVGLSRPALAAANARLLPFMTHDRVSLAGSMVTTAVMYCGLAWFGVRRGVHWARVSIQTSAFAGFATFFLFLGFGYFDPFHAFVTSALLQLLLLGVHSRLSPPAARPAPDLHETPRWRCALWGQLLFVAQAAAFIVAGFVISAVGATTVFVPEDLQYMHTSAHSLGRASARLLPLIAHDRATFGGMLVASGLVFLTSALWGFRRGERWLWWTTLAAGAPGYAAAIGVHYAVGYKNGWHLAPAFAGAALFAAGLALSYPYLCRRDPALEREWAGRVGRRVG
jgi:hypothetical protein